MDFIEAFSIALKERGLEITEICQDDLPLWEAQKGTRYAFMFVPIPNIDQAADAAETTRRMLLPPQAEGQILDRLDAAILPNGLFLRAAFQTQGK